MKKAHVIIMGTILAVGIIAYIIYNSRRKPAVNAPAAAGDQPTGNTASSSTSTTTTSVPVVAPPSTPAPSSTTTVSVVPAPSSPAPSGSSSATVVAAPPAVVVAPAPAPAPAPVTAPTVPIAPPSTPTTTSTTTTVTPPAPAPAPVTGPIVSKLVSTGGKTYNIGLPSPYDSYPVIDAGTSSALGASVNPSGYFFIYVPASWGAPTIVAYGVPAAMSDATILPYINSSYPSAPWIINRSGVLVKGSF